MNNLKRQKELARESVDLILEFIDVAKVIISNSTNKLELENEEIYNIAEGQSKNISDNVIALDDKMKDKKRKTRKIIISFTIKK